MRYGGIFVGIVALVPIAYVLFMYFSHVDRTVSSGSAYGFVIGLSKAEAYGIAQSKYRAGEIAAIDTIRNREEELKRFSSVIGENSYHTVSETRDWFQSWNHWSLWLGGDKPTLIAIVNFHGDRVSEVGQPSHSGKVWQVPDADKLSIQVGQDYREVYSVLETLTTVPGYKSLVLRTGWMARRQPVAFGDSEYQFIEGEDEWTLLVKDSRLNTIRLTFHQGRLTRIHRHRQYFELP